MSLDTIVIVGLTERQARQLRAVARLAATLAPLGRAALGARLAVSDQNGPKGGVAIRCTIDAQVARWAPIHADARATSARAALSEALDRFERLVRRAARMARDGRRRPKKYFAAAVANGGGRRP